MPHQLLQLKRALKKSANPEKALAVAKYFKAGKGEYGEGDKFIGVTVPNMRTMAKQFKDLPVKDVTTLLKSPIHEHRYAALLILVLRYSKGSTSEQQQVVNLYLKHLDYVNNWDLVDTSAPYILGPYLFDKDRRVLFDLASSDHLWRQRVAIISTYYFIRQNDFTTTLQLAKLLLHHSHDLIHKAVGWMLREVGNRNLAAEEKFLHQYYKTMPRTMLRYAIEKFPEPKRQAYLKGKIK